MQNSKLECIFEGICHLGEGPLWNIIEEKLYWTDIFNKRIWVYDPLKKESRIFWEGDVMVGGFAFTKNGNMVLCAEKGVYLLSHNTIKEIHHIQMENNEFFNDITTDPQGRIFAGTLTRGGGTGALYMIEKDKKPIKILDGISCSNGMTFSLDLKTFFHTNTGKQRVTAYDYDVNTGKISNPNLFYQGSKEDGFPDGLTIDTLGNIWQAFWGSFTVRRISPKGIIKQEIRVPAKQPSSVIFGGTNLNYLYITTACQGATNLETGMDEKNNVFLGGKVYRYKTDTSGRAEWYADFD
jgi:sugar lactone lactonase YvrE